MKAVIQRVISAHVSVDDKIIGQIGPGLAILLGIYRFDNEEIAHKMAYKVANLRVLADENQKMNRSLLDKKQSVLIVSQFTLYADTVSRRPGFTQAAQPEKAKVLYDLFVNKMRELGIETATGEFGAYMKLSLNNDGPVTIILDMPNENTQ